MVGAPWRPSPAGGRDVDQVLGAGPERQVRTMEKVSERRNGGGGGGWREGARKRGVLRMRQRKVMGEAGGKFHVFRRNNIILILTGLILASIPYLSSENI